MDEPSVADLESMPDTDEVYEPESPAPVVAERDFYSDPYEGVAVRFNGVVKGVRLA